MSSAAADKSISLAIPIPLSPPVSASTPARKPLPMQPEMHRVEVSAPPIGVDRKKRILRGYVVAQEGMTWGGYDEFDLKTLQQIKKGFDLKENGVKSRFTHPTMSDDGLGKFLGRSKDARLDQIELNRDGVKTTVWAVRADLHFDATAFDTPPGGGKPLGEYVMDLAESDSDALSSSIVCFEQAEYRLNPDGTPTKDANGNRLPPLIRIKALHASDIVDTGAAVDGLFSADMPDRIVYWKAAEMLDRVFSGADPDVVRSRCAAFLDRYLNLRGDPEAAAKQSTDFSINDLTGDEKMPDETPKTPAPVGPVATKSAPDPDSAAREARLREEIEAKVSAEYSVKLAKVTESLEATQAQLARKELEEKFSSGSMRQKVRQDERKFLASLILCARGAERTFSHDGKEVSLYDGILASIEARPKFIPDTKERAGDIPNQLSSSAPATSDEAMKKYAADNKLDINTMEGFNAAEAGAKKTYPEAFAGKEVQ